MKETLAQAMDTARESGRPVNGASGVLNVDLEQLPAYEELGGAERSPVQIQRPTPVAPNGTHRVAPPANNGLGGASSSAAAAMPDEPPPGYEEAVEGGKANGLEQKGEKN